MPATALSDDEFSRILSEIIQRNFFPDLSDIQVQNALLDMNPNPSLEELEHIKQLSEARPSTSSGAMTNFLEHFTSAESKSFQDLVAKSNRERKFKNRAMYEQEAIQKDKARRERLTREKMILVYKKLLEKDGSVSLIKGGPLHNRLLASSDVSAQVDEEQRNDHADNEGGDLDRISHVQGTEIHPFQSKNSLMFGPPEAPEQRPRQVHFNLGATRFPTHDVQAETDFDDNASVISDTSIMRATGQLPSTPSTYSLVSTSNAPSTRSSVRSSRSRRSSKSRSANFAVKRPSQLTPAARALLEKYKSV